MQIRKQFIVALIFFTSTSLFINNLINDNYQISNKTSYSTGASGSKKFCVIISIFNPASFKSRYDLYKNFEQHMQSFGVNLITVELAFFDRQFRVTDSGNPNHIQLRTNDVLWYKENLLNIALKRSPEECQYIGWIDNEVEFLNKNWTQDAIKALQTFKVVQLFDSVRLLGPYFEVLTVNVGYVRCNDDALSKEYSPEAFLKDTFQSLNLKWTNPRLYCATGYGWAARRQTLLDIGGFFDKGIVGSGDVVMSGGFLGKIEDANGPFVGKFLSEIQQWQQKAARVVAGKVGYLNNSINHLWHGAKSDRGYAIRKKIVSSSRFPYDPSKHLYYDKDGLLHFNNEAKIYFLNLTIDYFSNRKEDFYAIKAFAS
jgi:hypothetical protein